MMRGLSQGTSLLLVFFCQTAPVLTSLWATKLLIVVGQRATFLNKTINWSVFLIIHLLYTVFLYFFL